MNTEKTLKNHENGNFVKPILAVRAIIERHTEKLNTMKANRAKWEEEKWTDAECQECDRMIAILASILSDLNRALA
jgi:hypothetical protein